MLTLSKSKTSYQSATELLNIIDELDIVEFNRNTYSHFALHISNGLCVHVLGPTKRDNDQEVGTKSAQYLSTIAGKDLVRVNNSTMTAQLLFAPQRERAQCIKLALSGLPTDSSGNVVVGRTIPVKYSIISDDNCEGYATYWKYDHKSGWSSQAAAGVGYLGGITDRICATSLAGYHKIYEKAPAALKPVIIVVTLPVEAIRKTSQVSGAVVNAFTGALRSVLEKF